LYPQPHETTPGWQAIGQQSRRKLNFVVFSLENGHFGLHFLGARNLIIAFRNDSVP
jgi:hypothetical protein